MKVNFSSALDGPVHHVEGTVHFDGFVVVVTSIDSDFRHRLVALVTRRVGLKHLTSIWTHVPFPKFNRSLAGGMT